MNPTLTPNLVVFDCDGVLVDSEGPTLSLLTDDLLAHGLDVPAAEVPAMFVGGTMEGVFQTARAAGADLPDDWVARFYEKMFARLSQGVPLIDGVMEMIDTLEDRGASVWVASNGPMAKMEITLGPHGLWQRLAGRILSREHFEPKPDPDMVLHALASTGIAPQNAAMIDDSATGCKAGINAGVRTIGFATEGQDNSLRMVGAEVANSMADIRRMILT